MEAKELKRLFGLFLITLCVISGLFLAVYALKDTDLFKVLIYGE